MAGNIKGIKIEIGGDTQPPSKCLEESKFCFYRSSKRIEEY